MQGDQASAADGRPAVHEVETAVRILAVDGDSGTLTVLDGSDGDIVGRFTSPGGAFVGPCTSASGRYFLVNHFGTEYVTVIDAGLRLAEHGGEPTLEIGTPFVRATLTTGGSPAHYWTQDGINAIAVDADGTLLLLDEAHLSEATAVRTFPLAAPDHTAIVALDGMVLAGYAALGRVDAYRLDGTLVREHVATCPDIEGEGKAGGVAVFAGREGVLFITGGTDGLTARTVAYPPRLASEERTYRIAFHPRSATMFGDLPSGLLMIHPATQRLEALALRGGPVALTFNQDGSRLAVLTADGNAHVVEPGSGRVLASVAATTPYASVGLEEAAQLYPFIAAAAATAYLPDFGAGDVVELNLQSGQITRRFPVGGRPARVAVTTARAVAHGGRSEGAAEEGEAQ